MMDRKKANETTEEWLVRRVEALEKRVAKLEAAKR